MDQPTVSARDDAVSVPTTTDELISAKRVAELTGLSRRNIVQAAAAGHLVIHRPPPGVPGLVRYGRASAEALARSMVTLATVSHLETMEPRDGA